MFFIKYIALGFTLVLMTSTGCTLRYVAQYDPEVEEEIYVISKKVDIFFGKLLETSKDERTYQPFKNEYIEIEADLRLLLRRNEIRALNDETVAQIKTTLELWLDDKAKHAQKETVSDFIAKKHWEQYSRLFIAMIRGETAKDTE
jgi:hypothetical protein